MRLADAIGKRRPFGRDIAIGIETKTSDNLSDLMLMSKARLEVLQRLLNGFGIVTERAKLVSSLVQSSHILRRLGSFCFHRHFKHMPESEIQFAQRMRRHRPRNDEGERAPRKTTKINITVGDRLAEQAPEQDRCVLLLRRKCECINRLLHADSFGLSR